MKTLRSFQKLTEGITPLAARLPSDDFQVSGLSSDSEQVKPGDIFICLSGSHADRHDHIEEAVKNGASVIVCERVTDYLTENSAVSFFRTESTRRAAAFLWHNFCGRPGDRLTSVAVTGTNGKTTTAHRLCHYLRASGKRVGLVGTTGCFDADGKPFRLPSYASSMTTPPPEVLYPMLAEMVGGGCEYLVIEASSHALDQKRLDPLTFALGIFTNLSPEHLDYHASMEDYFEAKAHLFTLSDSALVNGEDSYGRRLLASLGKNAASYGIGRADYDFSAMMPKRLHDGSTRFEFLENNSITRMRCPLTGRYLLSDDLAALSAARLFGISVEELKKAQETAPAVPGRLEKLSLPGNCDFSVFIDYAHTPDALEKALKVLLTQKRNDARLIVVFGCGGDRDRTKRPVMGRIASGLADLSVITKDNCRSEKPCTIMDQIKAGIHPGADVRVIEDRAEAIRWVIGHHKPGDIILLAGKGHETYEIDRTGKHPFSEREIVGEAVKNLLAQ